MKKIILSLMLMPVLAFGQAKLGHFDTIELTKLQTAPQPASKDARSEAVVTLLVRVADDATLARLESAGAIIDQREGSIAVITVPLMQAEQFAATEGVITASLSKEMLPDHDMSTMGKDLSRSYMGLDRVFSAEQPLTQAYTGEGVVVGMIDLGVDVQHINFLNADGTHRVKRAWKHAQNGPSTVTLTADTEEKVAKFKTDNNSETHGTQTMGLAAGSFTDGEVDFRGGAPGADIAVSCGITTNATLLKGARAIVDYARSVEKPCVINISLGNNTGPHDGTDEFTAGLNEIASADDVSLFVSAGNEGAFNAFLYKEFTDGDSKLQSFISPSDYTAYLYPGFSIYPQAIGRFEIWSDDNEPLTIALDIVDITGGEAKVLDSFVLPSDGTGYLTTSNSSLSVRADTIKSDMAAFDANFRLSYIGGQSSVYAGNNRFHSEIDFQLENPDEEQYNNRRVALRIEGKAGHKVYVYGNPTSGVFPFQFLGNNIDGYTTSDGNGSVSLLSGGKDIITVGAYTTHQFKPFTVFGLYTIGSTGSYSSWGKSPDGRLHPVINAPGTLVVSSMSSDYVKSSSFDEEITPKYYAHTAENGNTYYFTSMTGTSMASPYAAGVAAMWLSADPTLTTAQIVEIAQETAMAPKKASVNDGASGHLNAFEGLCKVLGLTGVSDITADGAEYSLSRQGNTYIVRCPASKQISAQVFTLHGAQALAASANEHELAIDCSGLAKGIYVLSVNAGGKTASHKIVVK